MDELGSDTVRYSSILEEGGRPGTTTTGFGKSFGPELIVLSSLVEECDGFLSEIGVGSGFNGTPPFFWGLGVVGEGSATMD